MATGQYFTITDGTTSALFADGADPPGDTNYEIRSAEWAPAVSGLRAGQLASGGPFEDVIEDIPINVKGSTVAACLANLQTLQQLFDQAERWYLRRDNATVVEVRYSPKGATVSTSTEPLRAPIYGRVAGDMSCVQLPPAFTGPLLSNSKYVVGARMRFVRRGWWTLTTFQTVTSTSQTNGDLHTLAFGGSALKFPSIMELRVNAVRVGLNIPSGLLIISEKAAGIVIANAEDGSAATDYSSVANGTQLARNTNVLRFTPTVTTERETANITTGMETGARLFGVYANIRNNSSTTSFRIRASLRGSNTLNPKQYTPYATIEPDASPNPAWKFLGVVSCSVDATFLTLLMTASAASGTCDIDTVVVVDFDDVAHVIEQRNDGFTATSDGQTFYLLVREPIGTGSPDSYVPQLQFVTTSTTSIMPYDGNLFIPTRAATIYAVWLGTSGSVSQDRWRQATTADALLAGTMVANRYISYLVPE